MRYNVGDLVIFLDSDNKGAYGTRQGKVYTVKNALLREDDIDKSLICIATNDGEIFSVYAKRLKPYKFKSIENYL